MQKNCGEENNRGILNIYNINVIPKVAVVLQFQVARWYPYDRPCDPDLIAWQHLCGISVVTSCLEASERYEVKIVAGSLVVAQRYRLC